MTRLFQPRVDGSYLYLLNAASQTASYSKFRSLAELEHENDEGSMEDKSCDGDDGQDTVQVADPRKVRTDEGCSFPGQNSNLGGQKISQAAHFPGKASAVVAVAGGKESGAMTSKSYASHSYANE